MPPPIQEDLWNADMKIQNKKREAFYHYMVNVMNATYLKIINFTHKCKDSEGSYNSLTTTDYDKNIRRCSNDIYHIVNYPNGEVLFQALGRIPRNRLFKITITRLWSKVLFFGGMARILMNELIKIWGYCQMLKPFLMK